MSVTELKAARRAEGLPEDGPDGTETIADRAARFHELDEDEVDTLFPRGAVDGEAKVTLRNLIRAGEPVEVTAALMSAEVPLRGGLVDPRKEGKVVVSFEAARYIPIPQREGEPGTKRVEGWKIRCQLRPTFVEPADAYFSEEQVLSILERVGVPRTADVVPELLGRSPREEG